jgi:hypothetical protein
MLIIRLLEKWGLVRTSLILHSFAIEVATSTEESNKSPEEAVPEGEDHASSQINENIQGTIEHEVLQTRQLAVNGHDTTNLSQDKSEETHEHTNGSINHTPVSESHELDLENDAQPPFLDDDLKLSLGGEDALGASEVINEHSTAPPEEDGEGEDVPARYQEISADVLSGEVNLFPFLSHDIEH